MIYLISLLTLAGMAAFAAPAPPAAPQTNYIAEAQMAFRKGETNRAIALVSELLRQNPTDVQAHFMRAQIYERKNDVAKAIADYDEMVRIDRTAPDPYQSRGWAWFKLGQMDKAIADFDRYLRILPGRTPEHWQRGIAYYYAGRFGDGRKQFELHQTVNKNDVENAVWHFLCVARLSDARTARASLIPITGDARVPMMQVHSLFAGKIPVEEVFAAARAGNPKPAELENALFYANLYVGLYYEALGKDEEAGRYIKKAATEFKAEHYMGDVARVDQLFRERRAAKP